MYNKQQIAVKYAYQQLNKLLPEDFRKDITFSNALYLNSMLEGLLKEKLK